MWAFTRITVRSAWLPGKTGSAEPAVDVKIAVPVALIEQALSRAKAPKHKRSLSVREKRPPGRRRNDQLENLGVDLLPAPDESSEAC